MSAANTDHILFEHLFYYLMYLEPSYPEYSVAQKLKKMLDNLVQNPFLTNFNGPETRSPCVLGKLFVESWWGKNK